MIVGSKVKDKRTKLGISQSKLGELLGVTKVSVCGYEKGTRTPTLETFVDLLDILDIDANELLGREVKVVNESEEPYTAYVSKIDLQILKELKARRKLYNNLMADPHRTVELLDRLYK